MRRWFVGMWRDNQQGHGGARGPAAAALMLALSLAACSSGASLDAASAPAPATTGSTGSSSLKDKIASFFSHSSANSPQQATNSPNANVYCPYIEIREWAATLTIPPPPPDGTNDAMSLKYQGTFVRAARDCAVAADQLVMRVGIEGRIILGPAGGPGQIDVPLRIAVVDEETSGSKLIVTRLIHLPVTVESPSENPTFTHIEEGLSFPMPSAVTLENYVVYIGFDPLAAQPKARPEPKAKVRAKPKPNPNAPTG